MRKRLLVAMMAMIFAGAALPAGLTQNVNRKIGGNR